MNLRGGGGGGGGDAYVCVYDLLPCFKILFAF